MKGPNVDASKKEKIHVRVRENKLKSQIGKFHDNQKVSNL
tara:strand:- start:433 stop:552 length:120 start_codon:yes stop_codon:yes gene_type:complete